MPPSPKPSHGPIPERMPLSFHAFVLLLCWLPLPFGSNRPWSWRLMEVLVGGLLLVWGGAGLS
ncbi:MAG: hypothetical protein F8N37_05545, partial [Telmatospirillum sp.]|nr:hypothetical protein [Telmatospirillum sp.]